MFKKKWALCWDGPRPRQPPRRDPDGRRYPSGPHGGGAGRLPFPGGGPRFLLSPAPALGSAGSPGARTGSAGRATDPRAAERARVLSVLHAERL